MSGKRAKINRRRKIDSHKKIFAALLSGALVSFPLVSEGNVLFSIYPHAAVPIGENHDIQYGMGVGGKISYRPIKYFSLGAYGDYLSLSLPKVQSITVLDGGLDATYHIPFSDRMSLNAGINIGSYRAKYNSSMTGINAGMTVGISYRINPILSADVSARAVHYAAGSSPLLNGVLAQPGATFNLTEAFGNNSNIIMETKEIKPVFPVLYSWYENNSFGTISITNKEDSKIKDVRVSFYQPQYMGQPSICGMRDELEKGESIDVNLTAFFNEHMLEMTEKNDTQAIVNIDYTCLGQKRHCEYSMVVPVYGRNNMSWADDRRASVFVSSKDPAAMWFAKYISSIAHDNMRNGVPENIQYAMAIFDTLDQFGLNYVIDPSSAFEDNIGTESIDFLQFPYQTLMYRGGDCDDLSILVCSLFEAVGINTAFITIPGHIYMAFDAGIFKREAIEQFSSLDNFIVHGSEVWIPLEITLTEEGFSKAWRVGMREWKVASRTNDAAMYKMRDNWKIYKPVNVPNADASFTLPDPDIIAKIFGHSIDQWILKEIEPKVEGYKAILAKKHSDSVQNSLGTLYARYGLFAEAEEQFKPLRRKGYKSAILNTANIYFAKKDYVRAIKWYKEVLKKDKSNSLAYLGIARCAYELEDYDECDLAYLKVRSLDQNLASRYSYLGAFEYTTGRAFNLADRLSYTVWDDDSSESWKKEYKNLLASKKAEKAELYGDEILELAEAERDVDVPDYMKFNPAEFAIFPESEIEELAEKSEKKEGGDDNPDSDNFEDGGFEFTVDEEYVGLPNELEIVGPESVLGEIAIKSAVKVVDSSIELSNVTVDSDAVISTIKTDVQPVIPVEKPSFENAVYRNTLQVEKTSASNSVLTSAKENVEIENASLFAEEVASAPVEEPVAFEADVTSSEKNVESEVAEASLEESFVPENEVSFVTEEEIPFEGEIVSEQEDTPVTPEIVSTTAVEETFAPEVEVASAPDEESVALEVAAVPAEETVDLVPDIDLTSVSVEPLILVPDIEISLLEETSDAEDSEEPVALPLKSASDNSDETEVANVEYGKDEFVADTLVETVLNVTAESKKQAPENEVALKETAFEEMPEIPVQEETSLESEMEVSVEYSIEEDNEEFDLEEYLADDELPVELEIKESDYVSFESSTAVPDKEDRMQSTEMTEEPSEEEAFVPVENIAVPRFSKQPSEEWAGAEAYTAEIIPGMLSYEEEMGQTENSKAFLYEEDKLNIDPDKDFDVKDEKIEKTVAAPVANPFSSFLSKEDAAIVEKITDYKFVPKKSEDTVKQKSVLESEVEENLSLESIEAVSEDITPIIAAEEHASGRRNWLWILLVLFGGIGIAAKKMADVKKNKTRKGTV